MSILEQIYRKRAKFDMACADPYNVAGRIMLGWDTLAQLQSEASYLDYIYSSAGAPDEVCGLKVIKTKRARYIRILPKNKLKYYKKLAFKNGAKMKYYVDDYGYVKGLTRLTNI